MAKNFWTRLDRWMRWLHLYTGLFLVPWMMIYAGSALCLNHSQWFVEHLGVTPPEWKVEREVDFVPGDDFPREPNEQAEVILRHLDMQGAHRVQQRPQLNQLLIVRIRGGGPHRIIWHRQKKLLVVEKQQPFSFYRLMHFLHFCSRYNRPYFAHLAWAVIVDAVSVSIAFWSLSGIYIWARRPRKRLLGGIVLAGGILLFLLLVVLLCR